MLLISIIFDYKDIKMNNSNKNDADKDDKQQNSRQS